MKSDPYLIPHIKVNSDCILDLNIRTKIIKLLEENVGVNLHDLGLGSGFLDTIPNTPMTKEKIGPHQS